MTLDLGHIERMANAKVVEPETVLTLIARLRATEALVERAYREGWTCGDGTTTDTDWLISEDWHESDAKAALDALREGK